MQLMHNSLNDSLWMQEHDLHEQIQKYSNKQEIYWLREYTRARCSYGNKNFQTMSTTKYRQIFIYEINDETENWSKDKFDILQVISSKF